MIFYKWFKTPEGYWTLLRLLVALLFPLVIYLNRKFFFEFQIKIFDYFGALFAIFGLMIMIKLGLIFTSNPLFKAMSHGTIPISFVRTGPYEYVRHPFYFGFYLLVLGIFMIFPSWLSLIWLLIYGQLMFKAILEEEKKLISLFKNEYIEYRNITPKIIPSDIIKFLKTILDY